MLPIGLAARARPASIAVRNPIRASWIPDYSIPEPGKKSGRIKKPAPNLPKPHKKWWNYGSATADVGRPKIHFPTVSTPAYGISGGNGGGITGGGGGGGSGGGSGGDPMKGFTYLFGLGILTGGLIAWYKKGSSKSLIVSSGVGVLLFLSASLMGRPGSNIGTLLAFGTCLALCGLMGYRSYTSGKLMPAGIISALSAAMSAGYVRTMTI